MTYFLSKKPSPKVAVLPCGHLFYLTNVYEVKIWECEKLKKNVAENKFMFPLEMYTSSWLCNHYKLHPE